MFVIFFLIHQLYSFVELKLDVRAIMFASLLASLASFYRSDYLNRGKSLRSSNQLSQWRKLTRLSTLSIWKSIVFSFTLFCLEVSPLWASLMSIHESWDSFNSTLIYLRPIIRICLLETRSIVFKKRGRSFVAINSRSEKNNPLFYSHFTKWNIFLERIAFFYDNGIPVNRKMKDEYIKVIQLIEYAFI